MIDKRIFEQFRAIRRDCYVVGMISSHGGNLKPNNLAEIVPIDNEAYYLLKNPGNYRFFVLWGSYLYIT